MMNYWFQTAIAVLLVLALLPVMILVLLVDAFYGKTLFTQTRIGQHGIPFKIYKLKTMQDGQVTRLGKWLRKYKIDEIPQLINIIKGEMTFVGPRPDVPGYYDQLEGDDRRVLRLKPGLTSLAAIKYRNEEQLLQQQQDPIAYNDHVIFPDKVRMNLEYLSKRSMLYDIKILWWTLVALFK
jgi:lipopolysaccharide/colanic/teichoic acid biosynthesis glycosyltransferase